MPASQAGRRRFESGRPLSTETLRRTQVTRTFRRSEVRPVALGIRELSREPLQTDALPMARSPRVPTYRPHSSGQARVTLGGKDHLLGPYGSAQSKEAYRRLVAEWLERHEQPPPQEQAAPLTVNELLVTYWKHAEDY